MKSYKQFLIEAITDIVYHSTNKPVDILKTNKFYTSIANIKQDDKSLNKGKVHYFSTARTLSSQYLRSASYILVLDGRKLGQRYKSVPVDYWQIDPKSQESEDRIITDKEEIPNARDYITEIWARLPYAVSEDIKENRKSDDISKRYLNALYELIKLTKMNKIPLYIYWHNGFDSSPSDMLSRNKKRALYQGDKFIDDRLKLAINQAMKTGKETEDDKEARRIRIKRELKGASKYALEPYIELMKKTKDLSDKANDLKYKLLSAYTDLRKAEQLKSLKDDIEIVSQESREQYLKYLKITRDLKLTDPEDVVEFIRKKWETKY